MTRREEIEKAANDYINSDAVSTMNMQLAFGDFINGAEWADKTMIEKACEWIIENMPHYVSKDYTYEVDMADDFRKAMEE
jgi:hypothetical protein